MNSSVDCYIKVKVTSFYRNFLEVIFRKYHRMRTLMYHMILSKYNRYVKERLEE